MFWFVLYVIVSIMMSTYYTTVTCKETDLSGLSLPSKICFMLYFFVANILAWPVFTIFTASVLLNDM